MSEKIKVGNAEIEKANYDYFSLLYSKMPKEYVVADLVSKCENYDELYKSYERTQIELQQKENIIKEAIEYHDNCVNNLLDLDKIDENERLAYKVAYEIHDNYLKILKENK